MRAVLCEDYHGVDALRIGDVDLPAPGPGEVAIDVAAAGVNFADTLILNNHLLREHRRMRSKNLHYLDSPQFALLILITPYEAPQVIEEAPSEEQPQGDGATTG